MVSIYPSFLPFRNTGLFDILINQQLWFRSGEVSFRSNGNIYTTNDQSLLFHDLVTTTGSDNLGDYNLNILTWRNNLNEQMIGHIKKYHKFVSHSSPISFLT